MEFCGEKPKIRPIRPFKVTEGHSRSFKVIEEGINRKPICYFLLLLLLLQKEKI